jgi:D-serine deaminase-like pyridoxal phosphate-dependent protein
MVATGASPAAPARERTHEELEAVFSRLDAPFAFVDLDAMWSNGRRLLERAAGTPIRVASKSVRCRPLLEAILGRDPGYRGLMTFTLHESLWLAEHGFDDLLVAYPTTDRAALAALGRFEGERPPVVMVDCLEHLDLIARAAGPAARPVRVCLELDVGWWVLGGRVKVGVKRSPVRTPAQAQALARAVVARPHLELAGIMGYEAHIAGVGDRFPGWRRVQEPLIRVIKERSAAEIAERRAAAVDAVREVSDVELVNGGGTGSVHLTRRESVITEVTAGSGFFAPTLFDRYDDFSPTPAALFALPVVRKPAPGAATLLGGGYHASGPHGRDRLPRPYLPRGLRLDPLEGAGEVQTPVIGPGAASLPIGANVYLRHAKAGELCERFQSLFLLSGGQIVDEVPTYRGEGRTEL